MRSTTMPKGSVLFCAAFVAVALAAGAALAAPVQVHVSFEDYFAGGSQVNVSYDLFGNNSFAVGNTTGDRLWEVTEKAWWDQALNQTIISYTAFNDAFVNNITSVHFPVPAGVLASSVSAPLGWTGAQVGNEIVWQTTGPGIPQFESLDTMIVRYPGLRPITFLPNVTVDFADLSAITNINWVVTSVPEPATIGLLALGLCLLHRSRRR